MPQNQRIQFAVLGRRCALCLLCGPYGPSPCNGAQPSGELRRLLKLRKRLERQEQRLLGHILRGLPGAENLLRDQYDRAAKAPCQLVIGRQAAQQGELRQVFVALFGVWACLFRHVDMLLITRDRRGWGG